MFRMGCIIEYLEFAILIIVAIVSLHMSFAIPLLISEHTVVSGSCVISKFVRFWTSLTMHLKLYPLPIVILYHRFCLLHRVCLEIMLNIHLIGPLSFVVIKWLLFHFQ
uniref:Uncharacterized protein n=1 Tax=Cacopsylla melanoneura TaxID=428564 RepID=A0A8D8M3Q2_9HEMI